MQQALADDGGGEGVDVAQVGTVTAADDDGFHRPLQIDVPGLNGHDRPRSRRLRGADSETVSTRSSSRSNTAIDSPISSRNSTPRPVLVAAYAGCGLPNRTFKSADYEPPGRSRSARACLSRRRVSYAVWRVPDFANADVLNRGPCHRRGPPQQREQRDRVLDR